MRHRLAESFTMGSRALPVLKAAAPNRISEYSCFSSSSLHLFNHSRKSVRNCSSVVTTRCSLQPPDVPRLAETARISLKPAEIEAFGPKIRQVVDWFGQLQAVDLNSVEPALRADTEGEYVREDVPETFENREAIIASIPSYEEPYIKVPRVLNKE